MFSNLFKRPTLKTRINTDIQEATEKINENRALDDSTKHYLIETYRTHWLDTFNSLSAKNGELTEECNRLIDLLIERNNLLIERNDKVLELQEKCCKLLTRLIDKQQKINNQEEGESVESNGNCAEG